MNFGWLTESTSDEEFERVIVHEFGHALGCIHEHQSPASNIPWDKPKVYDYYKENYGWSEEKVRENILNKYSEGVSNSSYDRLSIMHYAVPNELTVGDYEVMWNTTLSEIDKRYIASIY